MNIFYQLIGFGALIAMGLSYWQNDKRTILLWQVVANLIFAIHYTAPRILRRTVQLFPDCRAAAFPIAGEIQLE